jgi:hypothetical protein
MEGLARALTPLHGFRGSKPHAALPATWCHNVEAEGDVANAVVELAGVRLHETPMTPERMRKAGGKVRASPFGFKEQGNDRD